MKTQCEQHSAPTTKQLNKSIMNRISIIFLLIIFGIPVGAQTPDHVIVANRQGEDIGIRIKWFTEQVMYEQGVNVYRQKKGTGQWEKINATPVQKFMYTPGAEDIKKDSTLNNYMVIAKESAGSEMEGFTKFMLLSKAIFNTAFAKYIGIEYTDTDAIKGGTYRYKVMQIIPGNEQKIGISSYITAGDYMTPEPPDSIRVKGINKKVKINWKVDPARFFAVNIYRSGPLQDEYNKVNDMPAIISAYKDEDGKKKYPETLFTDDSLSNNRAYTYKLTAIDYFGTESAPSSPVIVEVKDKKPPFPPSHIHANVNQYAVHITWQEKFSPDLAGYKIYRSKNNQNNYSVLHNSILPVGTVSFTDSLEQGGFYYYYVAAIDSSGNEGKSALTFADIPDIKAPAPPSGLKAVADTGRIILSWHPNTEPDLMGYALYRTVNKDTREKYVLMNATPLDDTLYIDSLPKKAKNKFLYRISAVDSAYNRSEYSQFAYAYLPDVTPPVKPYIKNILITDDDDLRIEWIANAETDLAGYNIYRKPANDTAASKEQVNINLLDPVMKRFTDRWAKAGTPYNYYLEALDSAGNSSGYSDPFPVTLPLRQGESAESIKRFRIKNRKQYSHLKWNIEETPGHRGCIVFRKDNPDAPLKPLTGLLTDEQEFKDTGIKPGNTYYYQIRAYHKEMPVIKSKLIENEIRSLP